MSTSPHSIPQEIALMCRRLYERGFITGTEGNVSVLEESDRLWITPSGVHKGLLQPEDVLLIDRHGRVRRGQGRPSSETPMHLALYQSRPDIRAVVHAHPPFATALTVARQRLDATLLPETVVALGEVPTIPYQMPTTQQFAQEVGQVMRHVEAVLLENHGSVTVSSSLQMAFNHLELIERTAQIFYLAKTLGHVQPLSPSDVARLQALRES